MRGWEMRWRILIMQSEGGICVVAESCHQPSKGIGLMASRRVKCHLAKLFMSTIQSEIE